MIHLEGKVIARHERQRGDTTFKWLEAKVFDPADGLHQIINLPGDEPVGTEIMISVTTETPNVAS